MEKRHTGPTLRAEFVKGILGTDPILYDKRPQIAFVGRSNVGKSSTLNALANVTVARTSATPGKTREINFFSVETKVDGKVRRYFFVDLPGYGYARMPVKDAEKLRKHIIWYLEGGETDPALVVLIIDAKVGLTDFDRELITIAENEGHTLVILANKADRLNQSERARATKAIAEEFPSAGFLLFSAKTKEGRDEVLDAILSVR